MQEKGKQVEGCQKVCQIFFPVSKIMLEMISLIFQGVIGFVFAFPASASVLSEGGHIVNLNGVIGSEAVVIVFFPCPFICDDDFKPVHQQWVVLTERYFINKAIDVILIVTSVPMAFDYFSYLENQPFCTVLCVNLAYKPK